jgi:hypothetical protein
LGEKKMTTWGRKNREKRDLHFLNADGMIACNPRDREAAHRADFENMATDNPRSVTCKKCWDYIRKAEILKHSQDSSE